MNKPIATNIDDVSRQRYARAAGFLFLWVIVIGLTGMFLVRSATGSVDDAVRHVTVLAGLYRLGLVAELVGALSAVALGFCLYVVLRRTNPMIAMFAFSWRFAEALLSMVSIMFGYARLAAFTGPDPTPSLVSVASRAGSVALTISALCFSIGSLLFFWLLWQSRAIPKSLAALGVVASVLVTGLCFGILLLPTYAEMLMYGWIPMLFAEVGTGLWLTIRGVPMPSTRVAQPIH